VAEVSSRNKSTHKCGESETRLCTGLVRSNSFIAGFPGMYR